MPGILRVHACLVGVCLARVSSKHLVVKFPCRLCFLRCDFLNRITDMNNYEVIYRKWLILEHEQADIALYALGSAHGAADAAQPLVTLIVERTVWKLLLLDEPPHIIICPIDDRV